MAPENAGDFHPDITAIRDTLDSIGKFLMWIVNETELVPLKVRRSAALALPEITQQIGVADERLRHINSTNDPSWADLTSAGLTGNQLQFKLAIGKHVAAPIERAASTEPTAQVTGSAFDKFFKWTNLMLGSLSKIPILFMLEGVKEYKEGVELVVNHQQSTPKYPGSILNLH